MDHSLTVTPVASGKSAVVLHFILGLLAMVTISGCQAYQSGQSVQLDSEASLFGPQSSFASICQTEDPRLPPVVATSPPPVDIIVQPTEFQSPSLVEGNDDFVLPGNGAAQQGSSVSDSSNTELPVYGGAVIRQATGQQYAYPRMDRQPQPFASGNPLRN